VYLLFDFKLQVWVMNFSMTVLTKQDEPIQLGPVKTSIAKEN